MCARIPDPIPGPQPVVFDADGRGARAQPHNWKTRADAPGKRRPRLAVDKFQRRYRRDSCCDSFLRLALALRSGLSSTFFIVCESYVYVRDDFFFGEFG